MPEPEADKKGICCEDLHSHHSWSSRQKVESCVRDDKTGSPGAWIEL